MGRVVTALLWAMLLFSPFMSHAQEPVYYFYGGVSTAIPGSPDSFSEYWDNSYGFVGGFGGPLSSTASLYLSVFYHNFDFSGAKFVRDLGYNPAQINITGGNTTTLFFSGDFKLSPSAKPNTVLPYVILGGGFFIQSIKDASVISGGYVEPVDLDLQDNGPMVNFGAGVDIKLNPRVYFFVEGRFVAGFIEGESTQYFPVTAGLSIQK